MADWLRPDWPASGRVGAICTTRHGGVSVAPYDSLNLAGHVGDSASAVRVNRHNWEGALDGARPVLLRQVHGCGVATLDGASVDDCEFDAAVTVTAGLACVVQVADCLPVLLCDRSGTRVAAAHAGWRGLAGGVLLRTLESICAPRQAQPACAATEIIAWLGPCIGPSAFEIGPEVRAALLTAQPGSETAFRRGQGDRWYADLANLARRQLQQLGVEVHGNDGSSSWCTLTQAQRYFSYRRDGITGRMAAAVWLR